MCTKRWKPSDPRRKRRTTESWRLAVRLVELAVVKLENFQVSKARTSQKRGGEASLRRGTRRVRVSQWATLEHFLPPVGGRKRPRLLDSRSKFKAFDWAQVSSCVVSLTCYCTCTASVSTRPQSAGGVLVN